MTPDELPVWFANWALGLPLIVFCIFIHVLGLAFVQEKVVHVLTRSLDLHRVLFSFPLIMAITALLATSLHGIEAITWATAYGLLDALPDYKSAMLYSLGAMTTYGHANREIADRWQLMGSLEALNGVLLFGLTTAYLFAVMQHIWLTERRPDDQDPR
jgi:uncharacterized membrane protein (DUF485 family)